MYVIELTYQAPVAEIEAHRDQHRRFLDRHCLEGDFLASGPKELRDGGVILASPWLSLDELHAILGEDPFRRHGLASYRITRFAATRHQPALDELI